MWLLMSTASGLAGASDAVSGDGEFSARANELARQALLVDTHIDMPMEVYESWVDVTQLTPDRNFDLHKALEGGLNVPFMSIYTEAELEETGGAYQLANLLIDSVEAVALRSNGKAAVVDSTEAARAASAGGRIALALGMENGTPIEGDLDKLRHFYDRGIRYITLCHSLSNHIADSSYDENRPWGGLSPFGRELVAEMNRLGIMVDVSHISDEAFYQAVEISKVPIIATHSSARHFTPGWERNMSDDMIRTLAANGGVIQINFGSAFLTKVAHDWNETMKPKRKKFAEEAGVGIYSTEAKKWQVEYRKSLPFPFATISELADHFEHVIDLVGVEHVGIGSDYDGVGDSLPIGLKDVSKYPALVEEFLRRGYSDEDIEAILGGNLMRVWEQVEQYAARQTP